MAITTAGELRTRVSDYLRRVGDTAFEVRIPDLVFAAEKRIENTASLMELRALTTLNLTLNVPNTAMPTDLVSLYGITLATPVRTPLAAMEFNAHQSEFSVTPAGQPKAYSIFGRQIYWGPTPNAAMTAQLAYQRRISYLNMDVPGSTNDVIAAHGHIYLYATLVEAAMTLGAMEGADAWGQKIAIALQAAIDNAEMVGFNSQSNTQAVAVRNGRRGVAT